MKSLTKCQPQLKKTLVIGPLGYGHIRRQYSRKDSKQGYHLQKNTSVVGVESVSYTHLDVYKRQEL